MQEIAKTGYWNGEIAHIHHVHCTTLSKWISKFLRDEKDNLLIDFGCGLGNYLKDLQNEGFEELIGFEADIPKRKVFDDIWTQDLTVPFLLPTKGNVLSLEVGEHIPAEFMNIYLDNICNNCNGYLIMSWAVRGQAGFGHVNCLNNDEIIPLIEQRGFKFLLKETEEVRSIDLSEAPWFKNTLLIFKKI